MSLTRHNPAQAPRGDGRRRIITLCGALLLAGPACRLAQADTTSRVFAAEVPGGAVRVLVVITDGRWPAGLRIEDAGGATLAQAPRDPKADADVDARTQSTLAALKRLAAGGAPPGDQGSAIVALRILSDWSVAQAAGMGVELAGAHPKSLRVVLLKDGGEPMATLGPVPVLMDSGPAAPVGLKAEAKPSGISLQWQAAASAPAVPAYAYLVTRGDGSSTDTLTPHPQLLTSSKPGAPDPFMDRVPPVEATVTYQLRIVDALGVPGAAASVQIRSPDFAAGTPPAAPAAKAGRGLITVTWSPVDNPRTRGLVVERAQLVNGPYERLTPEGLSPQTSRFDDHEVFPGASYYYRVRAVTPGGDLGAAGDPVRAVALGSAPLAAPAGLSAEAGASRITLSWKPVPGPALAGYIVERRASATPRWARLNARLLPDAHYVDVVGPGAGGGFDYRVTAVASDETSSAPSPILSVALPDTTPPAPPTVLSVSGANGRVQIRFAAAAPAAKSAQVALLRSESPSESGLIVGAPVPGNSGSIADDWVHGGQTYWYRLVAFDKAGTRSEESDAYQVRVGAVVPPMPKAPGVNYSAAPVPTVQLTFDAPPPHVRVIAEVQGEDGRWKKVSGPSSGSSAADFNPPGAHAAYRIVYVGESGGMGVPSPAASPK